MDRILKILCLVFLIPFYWGIGVGCSGTPGGGSLPLGGSFNGAAPGGGDDTGFSNPPSGQPTQGIVPTGKFVDDFYLYLKFEDPKGFQKSQCDPFVPPSNPRQQDANETDGMLISLNDQTGPGSNDPQLPTQCQGGSSNGKFENGEQCDDDKGCCNQILCIFNSQDSVCHNSTTRQGKCDPNHTCVVCNSNGQKDPGEICDDSSGCCDKTYCTYIKPGTVCQNDTVKKGECTRSHECLIPPVITGSIHTVHPSTGKPFSQIDETPFSPYVHPFQFDPCKPGEKVIKFTYPNGQGFIRDASGKIKSTDCKVTVDFGASVQDQAENKIYDSGRIHIPCPTGKEDLTCRINLVLKPGPQPEQQKVECDDYVSGTSLPTVDPDHDIFEDPNSEPQTPPMSAQ